MTSVLTRLRAPTIITYPAESAWRALTARRARMRRLRLASAARHSTSLTARATPARARPPAPPLRARRTTTADWWRGRPPKNYFFSFPYQNDETPLFYLRKLRVPLALRGSQNPKVEGPLARCPSFPVRKSRRSSDTSQLPRKKLTPPVCRFPMKKIHLPTMLFSRFPMKKIHTAPDC